MAGILLLLTSAGLTALAQTNAPGTRTLSLEDCIQSALEKNLDLRIARFEPPKALTDLQAAYAGYNPNFTFGGVHNYSKEGGGFNPEINTVIAGTTTDASRFNSSLGGLTPWGLNYNLLGNISESYGRAGNLDGTTAPFDSARGSTSLTLNQPLLKNFWIDQTRFNIQVGKNQVKYSELTLKQTIMNVVTTVEQAYYDLIYARENVTVQEKAVELATQLVVENKKRVEVGALAPLDEKQETNARRAFFSGHATNSFASAVFLSTVYATYFPQSPWKPVIWAASLATAGVVAWFRVASGQHFPTDVLTGAIVGSAVGFIVPELHRSDGAALGASPSAMPGGYSLSLRIHF